MYTLGLDIGYSNLKVAHGVPGRDPVRTVLPAGAGPADRLPAALVPTQNDPSAKVLIDGAEWAAGVPVDHLENWTRELHEDYSSSQSYLALAYAAIALVDRPYLDHLVTGLPVSHYTEESVRDRLANMLQGKHQVTQDLSVTVERVTVLPQPAGAYMSLVTEYDDPEALEEGTVVTIDPGFFSVDWVAMSKGFVRFGSSGTSLKAVSKLLDEAAKRIGQDHGPGVSVTKLENALRSRKPTILHYGERVEIAEYLAAAASEVAPVALSSLRESMRDEDKAADIVLLAGGGASYYQDAAREVFPRSKVVVPKDPVLANAMGFWVYGQ